ncbi:Psf2-domain-containing protein [Epithele typhae]|uniref:Psf2-domain-containing protein n=1 Tax=Epithele typhae TaxID=378194 RepID=UPI0020086662|nr:Psf2-domain-containing protein [Epithele typhae]KAH9943253.1 Psf2-domain-containing protein [Epithele typhae]
MALPPSLRTSITPPELELVASEQLVEIVPLVSMERTAFISGAYGPLRPPTKCKVPFWMASNLKLKKKCHIVPPPWLNVEFLQDRLTQETTSSDFSEMPFRFAEIAKILLDVASDDLQNPEKLRTLLKDIREARQAKSREGLTELSRIEVSLPNLCAMEINEIRPFFVRGMNVLTQLTRAPTSNQMDET